MKKVVLKSEDESVKGSCEVHIPGEIDRQEYLFNIIDELGDIDGKDMAKNAEVTRRFRKRTSQFVKSISFELSDGEKFRTFDKMGKDSDFDEICSKAQQLVIHGSLGKDSR